MFIVRRKKFTPNPTLSCKKVEAGSKKIYVVSQVACGNWENCPASCLGRPVLWLLQEEDVTRESLVTSQEVERVAGADRNRGGPLGPMRLILSPVLTAPA